MRVILLDFKGVCQVDMRVILLDFCEFAMTVILVHFKEYFYDPREFSVTSLIDYCSNYI